MYDEVMRGVDGDKIYQLAKFCWMTMASRCTLCFLTELHLSIKSWTVFTVAGLMNFSFCYFWHCWPWRRFSRNASRSKCWKPVTSLSRITRSVTVSWDLDLSFSNFCHSLLKKSTFFLCSKSTGLEDGSLLRTACGE